jgi:putative sigma-54 modulation protein
MRVDVRSRDIEVTAALREHVERRVRFALGRFDGQVQRVTARLVDDNGPRGGADKRCRLDVRVRAAGPVIVDDRDPDLYAAIDRAADRIGRAVARVVQRAHRVGRLTLP